MKFITGLLFGILLGFLLSASFLNIKLNKFLTKQSTQDMMAKIIFVANYEDDYFFIDDCENYKWKEDIKVEFKDSMDFEFNLTPIENNQFIQQYLKEQKNDK